MKFLAFMDKEWEYIARLAQELTGQKIHVAFGKGGQRLNELSIWATDEWPFEDKSPFWRMVKILKRQYNVCCPKCGGPIADSTWGWCCMRCVTGSDRKPYTPEEKMLIELAFLETELAWNKFRLQKKGYLK